MSPAPTLAPTDMRVATAHLREARRARGDALRGLASGALSLDELLELAQLEQWRALRQIPIGAVLRALGRSDAHARRQLTRFRELAGVIDAPRHLTLGWVVDRRATGRIEAFADAVLAARVRTAPVHRWPFVLVPEGGQR